MSGSATQAVRAQMAQHGARTTELSLTCVTKWCRNRSRSRAFVSASGALERRDTCPGRSIDARRRRPGESCPVLDASSSLRVSDECVTVSAGGFRLMSREMSLIASPESVSAAAVAPQPACARQRTRAPHAHRRGRCGCPAVSYDATVVRPARHRRRSRTPARRPATSAGPTPNERTHLQRRRHPAPMARPRAASLRGCCRAAAEGAAARDLHPLLVLSHGQLSTRLLWLQTRIFARWLRLCVAECTHMQTCKHAVPLCQLSTRRDLTGGPWSCRATARARLLTPRPRHGGACAVAPRCRHSGGHVRRHCTPHSGRTDFAPRRLP